MLGKFEGGRKGHDRMRWLGGITDSMDMSLVNYGNWWWTGRPGVLWSMGLQRVGHDWATELNWTERLNPHPLQWKREVITTGAPGKSSQFSFLVSANQITLHWPTRRLSKKDASLWLTNFWVSSAHGTVHILIAHSLGMCRAQMSYSWQHGEFAPVFSTTVQFCHYKKLNTAWPWPLASGLWNFLFLFRGHGFELWPGKVPHGMGQLRHMAQLLKPACLKFRLQNERSQYSEKPTCRHQRVVPTCLT